MDVSASRSRGHLPVALGVSITLNVILFGVVLWPDSEPEPVAPVAEVAAEIEEAEEPTETAEAAEPAEAKPAEEDLRVTVASLEGSIPQTMAVAADPYGDNVSATLSRVLVWDLDLRRDLRAGDEIGAQWSLGTTDIVVIEAARYKSQKHGRTIAGYRYTAAGDKYPSYWAPDGTEIPHQLKESPLAEYEQVTSLLKDRPTHHGMDFKVDVGTPVLSTRDGVVTRVNWNWSANGNCVEVKHSDGVVAKYLHLSKNEVKAGDRVKAGQTIALSGNTGRSTGPHLHYQLNQGSKVIDPIDYHGTTRRSLPDADKAAFAKVVEAADKRFESAGALAAK